MGHHVTGLPDSIDPSEDVFPPPKRVQGGHNGCPKPHIGPDYESYLKEYKKTVGPDADKWWAEQANQHLDWIRPFKTVRAGGFEYGDVQWL
jgi:acetyl-CoA synthetase